MSTLSVMESLATRPSGAVARRQGSDARQLRGFGVLHRAAVVDHARELVHLEDVGSPVGVSVLELDDQWRPELSSPLERDEPTGCECHEMTELRFEHVLSHPLGHTAADFLIASQRGVPSGPH